MPGTQESVLHACTGTHQERRLGHCSGLPLPRRLAKLGLELAHIDAPKLQAGHLALSAKPCTEVGTIRCMVHRTHAAPLFVPPSVNMQPDQGDLWLSPGGSDRPVAPPGVGSWPGPLWPPLLRKKLGGRPSEQPNRGVRGQTMEYTC